MLLMEIAMLFNVKLQVVLLVNVLILMTAMELFAMTIMPARRQIVVQAEFASEGIM